MTSARGQRFQTIVDITRGVDVVEPLIDHHAEMMHVLKEREGPGPMVVAQQGNFWG